MRVDVLATNDDLLGMGPRGTDKKSSLDEFCCFHIVTHHDIIDNLPQTVQINILIREQVEGLEVEMPFF